MKTSLSSTVIKGKLFFIQMLGTRRGKRNHWIRRHPPSMSIWECQLNVSSSNVLFMLTRYKVDVSSSQTLVKRIFSGWCLPNQSGYFQAETVRTKVTQESKWLDKGSPLLIGINQNRTSIKSVSETTGKQISCSDTRHQPPTADENKHGDPQLDIIQKMTDLRPSSPKHLRSPSNPSLRLSGSPTERRCKEWKSQRGRTPGRQGPLNEHEPCTHGVSERQRAQGLHGAAPYRGPRAERRSRYISTWPHLKPRSDSKFITTCKWNISVLQRSLTASSRQPTEMNSTASSEVACLIMSHQGFSFSFCF